MFGKRDDIYIKDTSTGNISGPHHGVLGSSGEGIVTHDAYIPDMFGDLKGPTTAVKEFEPNFIMGALVLFVIFIALTIYLPYKTFWFFYYAAKAYKNKLNGKALLFSLLGLLFLGFTFGDLYAWGEISGFNGEIRHATHERINNALAIDINQNFNVILTLPKCYMIGSRCLSSNVHIDLINHTNRNLLIRSPDLKTRL